MPRGWTGFVLRNAGRELRSQARRLALLALCLAAGFAAFFATYGFSGRVTAGIAAESRAMLGADLVVTSRGPWPAGALETASALQGVRTRCRVDDFPTMATAGAGDAAVSRLVEVRSVEAAYPLAGRLETNPPRTRGEPWGALVDGSLAQAWGLRAAQPGTLEEEQLRDRRALRLGDGIVPIQGIVARDDTRQATAFALGPRIFLGAGTARRLGLLTARSRFSSRLLLALVPGTDPAGAARELRDALPGALRVQTHEEAATALARPIRNTNLFIRQMGLLTLLLSSLGAWAILAAYLKGREKDAAILRCLGAPPGAPAAQSALVAALLLAAALVLGYGAGAAAARALPFLLGELVPAAIRQGPAPAPPWRETASALAMLLLVTAPSLVRLRSVAPVTLLREAPERGPRLFTWLCGSAAAALACALMARNATTPRAGLAAAAGLAALFLALLGAFRILLLLYRRSAAALPLPLKLALGRMGARPALGALLMAVMGLAVFLTLAAGYVKDDLVRPLALRKGGGKRANVFFIDVQKDQLEGLRALAERAGGFPPMEAPMVRARLVSVGGRPVEDGPERSMQRREQNLTWRERPRESESVVQGRFWPEGPEPREEISLEEGFARQIGAKLGDELVFDAAGSEVRGKVTSLRHVAWQSFQINFFIVMHPSLLQDLPAVWILAAEVDGAAARSALQTQAALRYPNVSAVDVGEIVERVGRVLDLVALVTRALAGLMLASALLVLAASLSANRLGRQRDLALLRAMGASHATLLGSLAWEFLLLGGSAAAAASVLAWLLAREYSVRVLELEAAPRAGAGIPLVILAALLTAAVGLAGSWRALAARPMDALRGD